MVKPCAPSGTLYTCTLKDAQGKTMLVMIDTSKDCSGSAPCETAPQKVSMEFTEWTDLEASVHSISNGMVPVGRKPILLAGTPKEKPLTTSGSWSTRISRKRHTAELFRLVDSS